MSRDRSQETASDRPVRRTELERQDPAEPAKPHGDALDPDTTPKSEPRHDPAVREEDAP